MAQRNAKAHLSMVKDTEIRENGERVAPRKSVEPVDHWAFLEEIEAPTWVDLNQESTSGYGDDNDDWFQISHRFHQCSSRELISASSHAGDWNKNFGFEVQGPSSPKLPPSVSRSRGELYKSREWGQSKCKATLKKRHPVKNLSSKSSCMTIKSAERVKTKPSNGSKIQNATSKAYSASRSCLTEIDERDHPKSSSITGDSNTSSCSAAVMEFENKSASTITSEKSERQYQKLMEGASQTVGHRSGLLSALKVTLRKSCVTRQASRMEIVGGRQSEGPKSSSGNSSVGSSSHPGYDVKNMPLPASRSKDLTPDSRNVTRTPQAIQNKVKVQNMCKESTANKSQVFTSKPRRGSQAINAAKSANLETAKSKVNQVVHSRTMKLCGSNEQDSVTATAKTDVKVGVIKHNRQGDGKENVTSQRSNNIAGVQVHKVMKQIASQKNDRTGLILTKGNIRDRREGTCFTNVSQKVYFR